MNAQLYQDETVVFHGRWKMTLIAVGALAAVAVAVPLLYDGLREGGSYLAFCLLLALADILFFGACLLYAVRRLRIQTPALILNAEGIYDDSSAVGAGFVAWEEIASVHTAQIHFQSFLCIVPKDIDSFLNRQPAWKRRLMRTNLGLVDAPITISAGTLPLSLGELKARIEAHLSANQLSLF